ncbi:Solute carrier family 12 member 4, partial [Toxocara canis]
RSTLCISLIRYVYDQQYAGKRDVDASERSMGAMRLPGYATQFMYRKISSLHSIASALANCCGVGAFHSNTVVLDYPSRAALSGAAEQILYHYHMHRVCIRQCNLIVVKGHFPLTMKTLSEGEQMKIKGNCGNLMSSRIVTPKFIHEVREAFQPQMLIKALSSQRMIDVWWIIDGGDTLLLLAHILKCNALWQQAVIRLFVVIEASDNGDVVENDIRRWLSSNHLILHTIEILHVDPSYVREYTFLRELKTRQRFREPPKHSLTTTAAAIFGLHNGSMLQSAVDRGYCPQSVDPVSCSYSLHPLVSDNIPRTEQLLRAQFLNKTISERSHGSSVVLLNIPEPPAQLERFWVYLTFVDKLTEGLNRALLIRGIDSETSAINYE